ncbi:MAG: alpha/beta hydrolase family protein [Patescibacteria group bacterium]|jgi:dipeptidyl aminopeptidase/acylaminoacyl peptidase
MRSRLVRVLAGVIFFAALATIFIDFGFLKQGRNLQTEEEREIRSEEPLHPMAIEALRKKNYEGSDIQIVETLAPGTNYTRYIATYLSEGHKIFGLLTVPSMEKPENGFPIIAFLHGYIPPNQYRTTERYVAYQDSLARNGFITFKIDMRGHGQSEGEAEGAHFSETYVVDTLNAIASLKKFAGANPDKIGVWGHSNGGEIGLRSMVISTEIDAGVFWAGVVGSFEGMLETYNEKIPFLNLERNKPEMINQYGLPSENPEFWEQIDPYSYLTDINGAIQLHHGTADDSVPIELSRQLKNAMETEGKKAELYEYQGGDHNLSAPSFGQAMERTVVFFRQHL